MEEVEVIEELAKVEARFNQQYTDEEVKMLMDSYGEMPRSKWASLCGKVLAKGGFRLPAVEDFRRTYADMPEQFKHREYKREPCEHCGGEGVRRWKRRRQFATEIAVARCRCENGKRWPAYPTMGDVGRRQDFERWITPEEIPGGTETEEMPF